MVHFGSHKSKRVVRSVMGGELYAFADGMDFGLTIRHNLEKITSRKLFVKLYTDSQCLFDVITKNLTTAEKCLMIDLQSARESNEKMEINAIAKILSKGNPVDALTKITKNQVLDQILDEGIVSHGVDQWIIRMKPDSESR